MRGWVEVLDEWGVEARDPRYEMMSGAVESREAPTATATATGATGGVSNTASGGDDAVEDSSASSNRAGLGFIVVVLCSLAVVLTGVLSI